MDRDNRPNGLIAWQWSLYPDGHGDHVNLILHLLTVPLFWAGTVAIPLALWRGPWWLALAGFFAMVAAIVVQGRGHRRETTEPVPFRGPLDVAARLFVEQWFTFPRYVLTGALARRWRGP